MSEVTVLNTPASLSLKSENISTKKKRFLIKQVQYEHAALVSSIAGVHAQLIIICLFQNDIYYCMCKCH